jgi:hypothetical protein
MTTTEEVLNWTVAATLFQKAACEYGSGLGLLDTADLPTRRAITI